MLQRGARARQCLGPASAGVTVAGSLPNFQYARLLKHDAECLAPVAGAVDFTLGMSASPALSVQTFVRDEPIIESTGDDS